MEDSTEASESPEQHNRKQINLLVGIAFTLVILMIMLVLAALGFLLYGLVTAKLGGSIIGVVACVIGFSLLLGLFRWVNKTVRRQTDEQERQTAPTETIGSWAVTQTVQMQDELSTRYQLKRPEKARNKRETDTHLKDELSTRYERAETDKD